MLLIVALVLMVVLVLGPQWWVKRVMDRHNREPEANFPGNGGELARHLLDRFGLHEVVVEVTEQGDHYDPDARAVRLTPDKYQGRTLTAITVAAHEVGHALQDAAAEPMFRWRSRLARVAVTAQRVGSFLLFAAPLLTVASRMPSPGLVSALGAFMIMGLGLVVQFATLPVELDASFRKALPLLRGGYLEERQLPGARRILRAAAWTYVAGSLASLLNFWRWMQVLRR